MIANNIQVEMTRRHFDLPRKVALRDSKIAKQIINAWDIEQDKEKVYALFLKNYRLLSSQRYWELLRVVWIVSGGLSNVDEFRRLMKSSSKHRYCFSTPEESKKLRNLPDLLVVYRACNSEDDGGISWTYKSKYADNYKNMFQKKMVLQKSVRKDEIFGLINRNQEYEIIIL